MFKFKQPWQCDCKLNTLKRVLVNKLLMSIKVKIRGPSPRCLFPRQESFVHFPKSHRDSKSPFAWKCYISLAFVTVIILGGIINRGVGMAPLLWCQSTLAQMPVREYARLPFFSCSVSHPSLVVIKSKKPQKLFLFKSILVNLFLATLLPLHVLQTHLLLSTHF